MRQHGFTLAELMIGLAVAGITVSVAVPAFSNFTSNQTQTVAANELVMAMNLARSEAIKQSRHVTICRSVSGVSCDGGNDWNVGWIVFANDSSATTAQLDAGEVLLRYFDRRGDPRTITPDTPNLATLSFRPTGTISTTVTWMVCDKRGEERARAIAVDRAGRTRVMPVHHGAGAPPPNTVVAVCPGA